MKKKILIFGLVFIIIAAVVGVIVSSILKNKKNDQFEFGLRTDNSYFIKEVKSKDIISIDIPSTYNGKPVKYIGENAFSGCEKLTSVTIPEGIEEIESYAFSGCEKLEHISIPNSITSIDFNAFENCFSLKYNVYENGKYIGNSGNLYITLISGIDKDVSSFKASENCKIIYQNALSGFEKLITLDLPNTITYIGYNAFAICPLLESFVVPNFVKHFDFSWFYFCSSLKSITLSANIETVSIYSMMGCSSFEEFNVYSANKKFAAKDGVLYSKNLKSLLAYPIAKKGDNFSIPSYVETITTYAFNGCINLKSLTMWSSIKNLNSSAVINCKLLHTINFSGTMDEWIKLDNANLRWDTSFVVNKVNCSNGSLNRSEA